MLPGFATASHPVVFPLYGRKGTALINFHVASVTRRCENVRRFDAHALPRPEPICMRWLASGIRVATTHARDADLANLYLMGKIQQLS
jgi:hypothetical protein